MQQPKLEDLIRLEKTTQLVDKGLLIKDEFLENIRVIKEVYQFDKLIDIQFNKKENSFELMYVLFSMSNKEFLNILVDTKEKMESLRNIYDIADIAERTVNYKTQIQFV